MSDTEDKRDGSEAEEKTKSEKAKGKRKARDDEEMEEAEPEKKGKRKATERVARSVKPRSRGTAVTNSDATNASKPKEAKPASRSKSKPVEEEEDVVENDAGPKKKRRKINIFPPSQPTSFPWSQLPQVSERLYFVRQVIITYLG